MTNKSDGNSQGKRREVEQATLAKLFGQFCRCVRNIAELLRHGIHENGSLRLGPVEHEKAKREISQAEKARAPLLADEHFPPECKEVVADIDFPPTIVESASAVADFPTVTAIKLDHVKGVAEKCFSGCKGWFEEIEAGQQQEAYIPFSKAIEFSSGALTRKKLERAIDKGKPCEVRVRIPRPQRKEVHVQDWMKLLELLSANNEEVEEKAAEMFGAWKDAEQKNRPRPDLS